MANLSVIIPAKDEEDSLKILLNELDEYKELIGEIVLVDGNSKDNTIQIAKNHKCKIISQNNEAGYGAAIIKGILQSEFEYSVILDGDGSKNPFYINELYKTITKHNLEFVFAERYGKNAKSLDDTFLTYIGNRIFTNLGKIFFNIKINDILHTFFICKNSSFKKIQFKFKDFGFCAELPIMVEKNKLNYSSVASIERKRIAGKVKVRSFVDGYKILLSMIKLLT